MKKMVCEICGSQSIRKENGVFVCKECGAEYSLDDAKKLLKETSTTTVKIEDKNKVIEPKEELDNGERFKLEYDLLCWHNFYKKCHELEDSFYLTDINASSGKDVASRDIVFNKEQYYEYKIEPKFKQKYIHDHPNLKTNYEESKQQTLEFNTHVEEEMNDKKHFTGVGVFFAVAGFFIGLAIMILGLVLTIPGLLIAGTIAGCIFFIIGLVVAIFGGVYKGPRSKECLYL